MTFTFKDILYIIIIILFNLFYILKLNKCSQDKNELIINTDSKIIEYSNNKKSYENKIDSLKSNIQELYSSQDSLIMINQQLIDNISKIKFNYENTTIHYIDTASIHEVIRYWTRELRSKDF